jgi:hypothetical protein
MITVAKKGNKITLTFEIPEQGALSASGKSEVFASTRGNQPLAALGMKDVPAELADLRIGLNVYKPVRA